VSTSGHRLPSAADALFLYLGGLAIGGQMFFLQEYTWDVVLHQAQAPTSPWASVCPCCFALLWQASRFRWAATTAALIYMLFVIAEILICRSSLRSPSWARSSTRSRTLCRQSSQCCSWFRRSRSTAVAAHTPGSRGRSRWSPA
jgi:hypothetical protein